MIRSAVGKDLGVRITPSIQFFLDGLPESTQALDSLLEVVHQRDAQLLAMRESAEYAGEADPYKSPRQEKNFE